MGFSWLESYLPGADLLVIALSTILAFLLIVTFTAGTKSFRMFEGMVFLVMAAAALNLLFHSLITGDRQVALYVRWLRVLYHGCLYANLALYVFYIIDYLNLEKSESRLYLSLVAAGLIVGVICEMGIGLADGSYRPMWDNVIREHRGVFPFVYLFFVVLVAFLLVRYRDYAVNQVSRGISFTMFICLLLLAAQTAYHSSSFTTATFLLPIVAMMYLIHSNPYDLMTGAVNEESFNAVIRENYRRKKDMLMFCLTMKELEENQSFPMELRLTMFKFYSDIVKGGVLFRLSGGRLLLLIDKDKNPDFEDVSRRLFDRFERFYRRYQLNFRCIGLQSTDVLSENNEYQNFFRYMDGRVPMNVFYQIEEKDIEGYTREKFITMQLKDIEIRADLSDERVLVYCQPVYNVVTGEYDTAEALMRMKLPELGFVFPDQFIPLAEKNNLIHPLSRIILNKTCREVRRLLDEGYALSRISVNFSLIEVHLPNFCEDIIHIIERNKIPFEKIAIELTESRNVSDFEMVKKKIDELKEYGIKFYLDDFGTGYSNFDRIMELPVDIIKFDRSLVIESSKDKDSEYMVYTFADMFNKLNYHVLYEGVENAADERRCIRMFAEYLQGYKYSKPIPIEELRDFFSSGGPDEDGRPREGEEEYAKAS